VDCFYWLPLSCLPAFYLQIDADAERSCNANTDNRDGMAAVEAKAAAPRANHDAMAKAVESQADHDLGQREPQTQERVKVSLLDYEIVVKGGSEWKAKAIYC
jgi:hypothetical protein